MASATPDLRLPFQPQDIDAARLVLHGLGVMQRHVCVNNLPKIVI